MDPIMWIHSQGAYVAEWLRPLTSIHLPLTAVIEFKPTVTLNSFISRWILLRRPLVLKIMHGGAPEVFDHQ
jgi:hypothetical protein